MRWNQQWWNHQSAVELDKVRWNQQQPHSKSSTVRRKAAECVNLILEKSTILCRPVGPTRLQWTDCTVHDVVGDQCALFALYALYTLCALCAPVHLCTCALCALFALFALYTVKPVGAHGWLVTSGPQSFSYLSSFVIVSNIIILVIILSTFYFNRNQPLHFLSKLTHRVSSLTDKNDALTSTWPRFMDVAKPIPSTHM